MGFWRNLFSRNKRVSDDGMDYEDIVYPHENVDFFDEEQRSRYITNCLEQLADASKEIELLTGEYSLVTSYLTDIEEIEALPPDDRSEINRIAGRLDTLETERSRYLDRKDKMKESDYYKMKNQENEIAEGIVKLKETEKYAILIKQDMQRLSGEKDAYEFRKEELTNSCANYKGMTIIFISALAMCIFMLVILQFVFDMNTYLGYFISIMASAVAVTILSLKYMDADKEILRVDKAINKLIQLQNTVKIRYVNNTNLLDYLYMKYNTDSAAKLEKRWERYTEEKELRQQFSEIEGKADRYRRQLVDLLVQYRVKDAHRWVHQTKALLDQREMVEIRHDLILRRQSLRKQLDYNHEVAKSAQEEIKLVASEYPQYADEIMNMVDKYDREGL